MDVGEVVLLLKVLLFCALSQLVYLNYPLFQLIFGFGPQKILFTYSSTERDNLHEWYFRWSLDRFTTAYGLLVALALHALRRNGIIDFPAPVDEVTSGTIPNNTGWRRKSFQCFSKPWHCRLRNQSFCAVFSQLGKVKCRQFLPLCLCCLALLFFSVYITFAFTCTSKIQCTKTHPYLVIFPLYVAQYHIWLSADTHGILVMLPGYPVLNLVCTTFILVCVCFELRQLTLKLQSYLLPPNNYRLACNLLIYLSIAVLVDYSLRQQNT
ncbi:hypothetical protein Ciccas_006690 [Cichlidogyrus casuarinus]|uniref:Cas1p 10 TM acyl transferase domain-containing protein n=1 Tax=Cichlidogyrus casuarinus TaxID=1844966 RepID=A0ABD2Q529_9PLAT